MGVKRSAVSFAIATTALLLLSFSPPTSVDAQSLASCGFDKIYQLGDSISDTGNLIRESRIGADSAFGKAPYGETTFHDATGRCSDGLLMIDYIALAAGLSLLPPVKIVTANFTDGANFAVAGSTALSATVLAGEAIIDPVTNSSLDVQLKWMKNHFRRYFGDQNDWVQRLQNSLFMVGEIGGNDYNYAFLSNKTMEEVEALVPQVVNHIKNAVRRVIRFGARKIVVPGNFPIGCLPVYLTTFKTDFPDDDYDKNHCLKGLNQFAMHHNEKLQKAIEELQQEYPQVTIVYGDYYNAYQQLLNVAGAKGFDLLRACCGTGGDYNFNPAQMCGSPGATVCSDPSRYVSWDGIHPTQEAYRRMSDWLLADFFWKFNCDA